MALSDNDINIKIKYETEGTDELEDAQQATEDLGKSAKEQAGDVANLTVANKANASSMKTLGTTAVSLASKLSVVGIAVGAGVGIIKGAVGVVQKYTAENERLQSSYATLTTTINTQAGTIINDKQLKEDVKDISEQLHLSQERITEAMTKGVSKTHNYALSMEAVQKAYELASAGVGTFEENYDNLIDAYTGGMTVFDETGQALQPGINAFNEFYDQVKDKGNKTWGDIQQKEMEFGEAQERLKQSIGERLQGIKGIFLGLFTEVTNAMARFDWKELINLLIIDPVNAALHFLSSGINTVLGWVNKLFKTNLSVGDWQITRLTSATTQAAQQSIASQQQAGLPDFITPPAVGDFFMGRNPSPTVNVQVEGSVWTTKDLASELSGIMFDEMKLRGAR